MLIGRHIRSDLDWLPTRDPIDDHVDELVAKFTAAARSKDGRITVDTDKDPSRTVLRVLHELRDFPDTQVVVRERPSGARDRGRAGEAGHPDAHPPG